MFKRIASLIVTVLGIALLVYSATRSLDFIELTLPPERQILAYFGLAALDGGLVAWLLSYLYGSRGWQRAIALLMVIVDTLGAIAMFTLDTLYNSGQAGLTAALTTNELQTAILALSGIIALNVAATIAHHILDPDQLKAQAEEESMDHIDNEELAHIRRNAASLAAEVAPIRASNWKARKRAQYLNLANDDRPPAQLPPGAPAQIDPAELLAALAALIQANQARQFAADTQDHTTKNE